MIIHDHSIQKIMSFYFEFSSSYRLGEFSFVVVVSSLYVNFCKADLSVKIFLKIYNVFFVTGGVFVHVTGMYCTCIVVDV